MLLLLCNLLLGASLLGLILHTVRVYCSRGATLAVGGLLYAMGTLMPGVLVVLPPGSLVRSLLTAVNYLIPQFSIYQETPDGECLLINLAYFLAWAGHLWFVRQLWVSSEERL